MKMTDSQLCLLETIRYQEKWGFSLTSLLEKILKERIKDNNDREAEAAKEQEIDKTSKITHLIADNPNDDSDDLDDRDAP